MGGSTKTRLLGGAELLGGAAATAMGMPWLGVPMMAGGLGSAASGSNLGWQTGLMAGMGGQGLMGGGFDPLLTKLGLGGATAAGSGLPEGTYGMSTADGGAMSVAPTAGPGSQAQPFTTGGQSSGGIFSLPNLQRAALVNNLLGNPMQGLLGGQQQAPSTPMIPWHATPQPYTPFAVQQMRPQVPTPQG